MCVALGLVVGTFSCNGKLCYDILVVRHTPSSYAQRYHHHHHHHHHSPATERHADSKKKQEQCNRTASAMSRSVAILSRRLRIVASATPLMAEGEEPLPAFAAAADPAVPPPPPPLPAAAGALGMMSVE